MKEDLAIFFTGYYIFSSHLLIYPYIIEIDGAYKDIKAESNSLSSHKKIYIKKTVMVIEF